MPHLIENSRYTALAHQNAIRGLPVQGRVDNRIQIGLGILLLLPDWLPEAGCPQCALNSCRLLARRAACLAARYRWTPLGGSQAEFEAFLKNDRETYRKVIELAKIPKSN